MARVYVVGDVLIPLLQVERMLLGTALQEQVPVGTASSEEAIQRWLADRVAASAGSINVVDEVKTEVLMEIADPDLFIASDISACQRLTDEEGED